MKKGVNPSEIFLSISKAIEIGIEIGSTKMKEFVIDEYNQMYGCTSRSTVISNLREDAMVFFQEEMFIAKLPQDNNKVDLIASKIVDGKIHIVISQQKGNNASFNSTSLAKTLEQLKEVKTKKFEDYFKFLPDYLNPIMSKMDFEVDVIIGFTTAYSTKVESYKSGESEIKYYCADMYLEKMGIVSKKMVDVDWWVVKQEKVMNHNYDAISECVNFDEVYDNCIKLVKTEI